jgi:hypothetical protein
MEGWNPTFPFQGVVLTLTLISGLVQTWLKWKSDSIVPLTTQNFGIIQI